MWPTLLSWETRIFYSEILNTKDHLEEIDKDGDIIKTDVK
jgi:hypothetical protein